MAKSYRKELAVVALISQPSIAAAAEAAGISESTLYRWLANDAQFQKLYRDARKELVQQATSQLQRAAADAVKALEDVLRDATASASAKIAAARTILELAFKAAELEDMEARVSELERKVQYEYEKPYCKA